MQRVPDKDIYEVVVKDNTDKTETYQTTQEHPFLVVDSGWMPAHLLQTGMTLVNRDDQAILTVISQTKLDKTDTVYNFTVDEFHTYHIGKFGTWVHNDCIDKVDFNLNRLPQDIKLAANQTIAAISSGTRPSWLAAERGQKWGSEFKNSRGDLPKKTASGETITYKEYDIQNVRDGQGAGIDRIVVGSDGCMYYTGSHYGDTGGKAFGRIK